MKILITGASGFIGSHLAKRLSEDEKNKIYCLVRDKKKAEILKPLRAEIILGDITKPETIKNLPVVDEVYHLAGKLGKAGVPDDAYWDLHLRGTKNLVTSIKKDNLKHFFFFSSPSVAGPNIGDVPWKESDPYAPSNIYEKTKVEAEKFLLSCDLPLVIVRPEFVYGPGDRHVIQLIKAIKERRFPIIGSGKNLLQPTYIDDVVLGIETMRRSDKVVGQTYHLAGEERISLLDYVNLVAETLGVKFRPIRIPKLIAYFVAVPLEISGRVFGKTPPLSFQRIRFFTKSHIFSTDKARKDLNWRPEVSLRDGLSKTIKWNKEHGYI